MIIGSTFGVAKPSPHIIDNQVDNQAVRQMQAVMILLKNATGNQEFARFSTPDGKVGARVVWGLYQITKKGVAQIPVLGTVVNSIVNTATSIIPLVNLNKYESTASSPGPGFTELWNAALTFESDWLWSNVVNPIIDGAAAISSKLDSALSGLNTGSGSGSGTNWLTTVAPVAATYQTHYPPGTVGVRNPLIGKYHILIPVVK